MQSSVYIETSIPSYYFDERETIRTDIDRTREWWDNERKDYQVFSSAVVLRELSAGDFPRKVECLRLLEMVPLLAVVPEIDQIAALYCQRMVMPRRATADAFHLAIASYYRMDYLLTWNCRHLANANKFPSIQALNQGLGLHVPRLVTPHLLQPWSPP